jgi:hypothetical protein
MTRTNRRFPLSRRQALIGIGAAGTWALAPMGRAAAQGADIPIGMVLPFSGATGAYGPDMKKAAEIVVGLVNDAGGILGGRKLKLYIEDSESNPTVGVAATASFLPGGGRAGGWRVRARALRPRSVEPMVSPTRTDGERSSSCWREAIRLASRSFA